MASIFRGRELMDVRLSVIEKRLYGIRRIIAITAGKGGVGKSSIASLLALSLSDLGKDVGLFDLDLSSPSAHIILGLKELKIKEEKGIIPPSFERLKFMSPVLFSEYEPLPLRGEDISNAIVELFSVTLWGELDFLLLDMPPGTSDAILEIIRLIKRIEFIVVFTPSFLSLPVVKRHIELIKRLGLPIICFVENLRRDEDSFEYGKIFDPFPLFFSIPFDRAFETALGERERLRKTEFFKKVEAISHFLLKKG